MKRYIDLVDEKIDYACADNFDRIDSLFSAYQKGPRYQPATLERDRGSIAWGAALVARSYILMYKHSGDERYLRKFVGSAEQILLGRDSDVGLTDYRGVSGPVWSSGRPYTSNVCFVEIENSECTLEIRSKSAYRVEIATNDKSFDLSFLNIDDEVISRYSDMNLDKNSEKYVTKILSSAHWKQPLSTAKVFGDPSQGVGPKPGVYELAESFYVAAVETGQICGALVEFCCLINDNSILGKYKGYSERYLQASIDALEYHLEDHKRFDDGRYLSIATNAPHDFEGTDAPLNHLTSIARCYTMIFSLTQKLEFKEIAFEMMSHFKKSLSLVETPDGLAYTWPYFSINHINYSGFTEADNASGYRAFRKGYSRPEDISHAIISIEAVVAAVENHILFDAVDLKRFARTFLHLIKAENNTEQFVANYVDGTGGYDKYLNAIGRWAVLTPWENKVWEICRTSMNKTQPVPEHATVLLGLSVLSTSLNNDSLD